MSHYSCWSCSRALAEHSQFCPGCGNQVMLEQGRYRIVRHIGGGGFGHVYEVQDTKLQARRAAKVLTPATTQDRRQIEIEWTTLRDNASQMRTFVPQIFDVCTDATRTYLVMEYIEGKTLSQSLDGPWPAYRAEAFLRTILTYLVQLHDANIVHRDLKPANIILRPDGSYMLIDFGISHTVRTTHLSGQSVFRAADPHYAPWEQLASSYADPRSDLYSLAATTYALLTYRRPPPATERAQGVPLTPPSSLVSGVPPTIEHALLRMLELQPEDRPQNAREALQLLSPRNEQTVHTPPYILQQPAGGVIRKGDTARLQVSAGGTGPLSYQWYQGGRGDTSTPISGATSDRYTTRPLDQTTDYWVQISNASGPVSSETARMTVKRPRAVFWLAAGLLVVLLCGGGGTIGVLQAGQFWDGTIGDFLPSLTTATATTTPTATSRSADKVGIVDSTEPTSTSTPATPTAIPPTVPPSPTTVPPTVPPSPTAIPPTAPPTAVPPSPIPPGASRDDLGRSARFLYGPTSGEMLHEVDNYIETVEVGTSLRDFIVEARFTNPYAPSEMAWDYGFMFRYTGTNQYYGLIITSEGEWSLSLRNDDDFTTIAQQPLDTLNLDAGESNMLRLMAHEDQGYLTVNNQFVATLDLSDKQEAGDVNIATGYYNDHEREGSATRYDLFSLWALEQPPDLGTNWNGTLIASDDFVDNRHDWNVRPSSDGQSSASIRGGIYIIDIQTDNLIRWEIWREPLRDFVAEIDVAPLAESASGGIIFGYQDSDNFFIARVSSYGDYTIEKLENDEWETLADWQQEPEIRRDGDTNRLTLMRQGSTIRLYVNGIFMEQVEDSSFATGEVGVVAGSGNAEQAEIMLDNFRLWQLP